MRSFATLAAASLVLLVTSPLAAPAPTRPAAPGAKPATRPRAASPAPRLPDSVLARLRFPGGAEDITRDRFLGAMAKFGLSPDSTTPAERRQVLDVLIQQRVLAWKVRQTGVQWTQNDSTDMRTLTDRLTLHAVLDSAMADLAAKLVAKGDTVPDRMDLGRMLRDSAMARVHAVYDTFMVSMLAGEFKVLPRPTASMSIQEQLRVAGLLPTLTSADSAHDIIRSDLGAYTAGELLRDFARLDPMYRPAVRSEQDVRDLASSTIYEKMLRANAAKQDVVHSPPVAAALAERREYLDVQRYVARNAYDLVPLDSTALRRHFALDPDRFAAPGHAQIVRAVFDSIADARAMMRRLTVPGEAESLAAKSMRSGVPYEATLSEDADTALFARVLHGGPGAVLGPDIGPDGWRVLRVMSVTPRRRQPFSAAAQEVARDLYEQDGDRRTRELVDRLVRSMPIQINTASPLLAGSRRKS